MEKNIIESNKLIAEFMQSDSLPHRYNTDWNWLMPVVEKIEKHGCIVEISYALICNCRIVAINGKKPSVTFINDNNGGKPAIEAVYNSVVEFIKWYSPTPEV